MKLAEQVEKGLVVVRRPMRQWMMRITAYAERLLKAPDKYRDRSDNVRWKRERAARENAANPQKAVAAAASPD